MRAVAGRSTQAVTVNRDRRHAAAQRLRLMILAAMKINTAITARAGPKRLSTTDPTVAMTSDVGLARCRWAG